MSGLGLPPATQHGCHHARAAAELRYGVFLEEADFAAMVADIVGALAGEPRPATLLFRQRSGREIWAVRIPHGPAVRVAYAPERAQIVTVLPRGYRLPGAA